MLSAGLLISMCWTTPIELETMLFRPLQKYVHSPYIWDDAKAAEEETGEFEKKEKGCACKAINSLPEMCVLISIGRTMLKEECQGDSDVPSTTLNLLSF